MIRGLNHLTFAVAGLERSITFYRDLLGMRLAARWDHGAYLESGALWLCLARDRDGSASPADGYTHYAFSLREPDLAVMVARLRAAGCAEWQANTSEGASFYVLDPDGHKLELHVGTLASRLAHCRQNPYPGLQVFD